MQARSTTKRRQPRFLARDGPVVGALEPTGRFALHFLEMCVVMCVGGGLLSFAFFQGAAWFGHPHLVRQAPALSILVIAVNLALAMAIYMRLRGHGGRHNLEMSGSTAVGGFVLVGAYWAGIMPQSDVVAWQKLFSVECGPLCLVMLAAMVPRFNHYAGRAGRSHAR